MRAVVIFVLSFVASIFGYQILTPGEQNGWTNSGPQSVTWIQVDTDSSTFNAVLTNQVISGFADETLATNVDGTTGSTQLSPLNGGTFPTGPGFRLNFMSTQQPDTILAQSNQFNITAASSTSGTSGTTGTTITATSLPTSQTGSSDSSGTNGGIIPTSSTSTSPTSTSTTSGAASFYPVQTGLLVLISFLGFALA